MTDSPDDPLQRIELLQQVLALLPVGIRIADGSGRIVYGNPAAHAVWAGAHRVGIDGPHEELRGGDVLARYGGEEFVIAAPGIGWRQAAALAERLRTRIAAERIDNSPRVTCSFGLCEFNDTRATCRS